MACHTSIVGRFCGILSWFVHAVVILCTTEFLLVVALLLFYVSPMFLSFSAIVEMQQILRRLCGTDRGGSVAEWLADHD